MSYYDDLKERAEAREMDAKSKQMELEAKRAEREFDKEIAREIERLGRIYDENIDWIVSFNKKDAFIKLIHEYLKYSNTHQYSSDNSSYDKFADNKGWEERSDHALLALRIIKAFRVPTDREKLALFCESLEENEEYLKEECKESKNYFLKDVYKSIIEKTDKAYDQCYKDYQRPITEEEQKALDEIDSLQKSGKPDAILSIVKHYPNFSEIQKWGSKKGEEANPVAQAVLKALNGFEAPTNKEALTEFMQAVIAQKDQLKQWSTAHKHLNFKSGILSKNLYSFLIDKGDKVINQYFKNETDGFIGERLGKKAQNKKYMIYGGIAVVVIIVLLILFT